MFYMLLNPTKSQGEIARDLGYTQSWVSTIVNTDMFQQKYAAARQTYEGTVFISLHEKTTSAAHMALDRLMEKLESENTLGPDFYLDATNKLLQRLTPPSSNPTPGPNGITQNNLIVASAEDLARANQALRKLQEFTPPLELVKDSIQGTSVDVTSECTSN
jgi:hypothetical protein